MLDNCEHAPGSAVTRGCRRCYEELNPAPIPPEHVYSHITIPQLMKCDSPYCSSVIPPRKFVCMMSVFFLIKFFIRNFCTQTRTRTRNTGKFSYNILLLVYNEPPRTPNSSAAPTGDWARM